MTLSIHLQMVGALLMVLGLSHVFFSRYFGWRQELAGVTLLTRRVFFVHTFFIGLGVTMNGAVSLFCARTLLVPSALSSAVLAGMAVFWFCRLLAQFFAYDAVLWRGDRFRTFMHVAFSALWCYVTATYGLALISVWSRR